MIIVSEDDGCEERTRSRIAPSRLAADPDHPQTQQPETKMSKFEAWTIAPGILFAGGSSSKKEQGNFCRLDEVNR